MRFSFSISHHDGLPPGNTVGRAEEQREQQNRNDRKGCAGSAGVAGGIGANSIVDKFDPQCWKCPCIGQVSDMYLPKHFLGWNHIPTGARRDSPPSASSSPRSMPDTPTTKNDEKAYENPLRPAVQGSGEVAERSEVGGACAGPLK